MAKIFEMMIEIKPLPWSRTRGMSGRRFMTGKQRQYYQAIYLLFKGAGFKPLNPLPQEYGIALEFHRTDNRWVDTDNLVKAILDAGQPSKWGSGMFRLMPDLWDDAQFSEIHGTRYRGAEEDKIKGRIWI